MGKKCKVCTENGAVREPNRHTDALYEVEFLDGTYMATDNRNIIELLRKDKEIEEYILNQGKGAWLTG